MELNQVINRDIVCACGRIHRVDIGCVAIERGALERLPGLCAAYRRIVLVADSNTWRVCGHAVPAYLGDRLAAQLVFPVENGHVVPNEESVAAIETILPANADLIIGVGSGVINDLCKFVSFRRALPYFIIATAPSMDGFASSGAAMIWAGMKVTFTTHTPSAILGDLDVLCAAPRDLIKAGYGDMVGKYNSLCDWRLAAALNDEYICPFVHDLVKETADNIVDMAEGLMAGNPDAIRRLTEGLILSGVSLSMVGTTRPGSGSEHHLSHFAEIVGLIRGEFHYSHGLDVGYAAVLTGAMRERMAAIETPEFDPDAGMMPHEALARIYGDFAGEVEAIQEKGGWYANYNPARLADRWPEVRRIFAEAPGQAETRAMLERVGLDFGDYLRAYGEAKIGDAMLYGKDLKDRYSMLWLYWALFRREADLPGGACAAIARYFADNSFIPYYPVLAGKRFNLIGDSYVSPGSVKDGKTWSILLAEKYGMELRNYGIGGNGLASPTAKGIPMVERYVEMEDDADIVMVVGGRNDFNKKFPVGEVGDTTADTFAGAVAVLIDGLRAKYPNSLILFATAWYVRPEMKPYTDTMLAVCTAKGMPCLNAADQARMRVYMNDPAFRARYCIRPTDVSHLNAAGMKLVMPAFEAYIAGEAGKYFDV